MTQLNIAFLIIGTLASFIGVLVAAIKLLGMVKARWVDDQRYTDAVKANTTAVQQLTQAVNTISSRLDQQENRLTALEHSNRRSNGI